MLRFVFSSPIHNNWLDFVDSSLLDCCCRLSKYSNICDVGCLQENRNLFRFINPTRMFCTWSCDCHRQQDVPRRMSFLSHLDAPQHPRKRPLPLQSRMSCKWQQPPRHSFWLGLCLLQKGVLAAPPSSLCRLFGINRRSVASEATNSTTHYCRFAYKALPETSTATAARRRPISCSTPWGHPRKVGRSSSRQNRPQESLRVLVNGNAQAFVHREPLWNIWVPLVLHPKDPLQFVEYFRSQSSSTLLRFKLPRIINFDLFGMCSEKVVEGHWFSTLTTSCKIVIWMWLSGCSMIDPTFLLLLFVQQSSTFCCYRS
jgi:hypothetical protein